MCLPPPSMSTPPVADASDVPVPTLCAAHTLRPNLSAEHIGVEPPRIGEDPSLGHLTAGRILRRLDRRLPLRVCRSRPKDQRTPEDRLCHFPHGLLRLQTQELEITCTNPEKHARSDGCVLRRLRMTEADKLFALIASAMLAALFVHHYADLAEAHVRKIIMVKAAGDGMPTD